LQIFNAHPALSRFDHPILSIGAAQDPQGRPVGVTTIGTHEFNTTGLLGASGDPADGYSIRAFPAWATLPGAQWLAMGRRWHFFFAWIFVVNAATYGVLMVASVFGATSCRHDRTFGRSAVRSGIISGCASREVKKPSTTTSFRYGFMEHWFALAPIATCQLLTIRWRGATIRW
jgi:hypothetical protein